ncbi:hypothetical protein FVER14953_20757 [Fusarium verticillioides]|nr:hypothetical protein FVER14953_20757 [Fusarium verticillioides]
MQLLTYITPEQSLLLRSSPFVSGTQPPAPSVLDGSATAAAPAPAPRTGGSRAWIGSSLACQGTW